MIARPLVRIIVRVPANTTVTILVQVALLVEDARIAHLHVPAIVLLPVVIHAKKDVPILVKVQPQLNQQQVL